MNTPLSNIARVLLLTVGLATAGISFAQQGAQSPTPQKVESVNIMDVGRAPNATSQAAIEASKNQPGNNAPIWRTVNSETINYTSIPGAVRCMATYFCILCDCCGIYSQGFN